MLLVLIVLSLSAQCSLARPVSYPGGVTADISNNGDEHSVLLHYSPSAKYSLGIRSEYRRAGEYLLTGFQLNNLVKRWNKKDSQMNLYLKSGIGYADRNSSRLENDSKIAIFSGISGDWESREYFISYENRYLEAGSLDDFFMQRVRVGMAPYIADYGALHTWLMVEVEHIPESENNITLTPLVRLLKDVHRFEAGISSNRDVLLNWAVRF